NAAQTEAELAALRRSRHAVRFGTLNGSHGAAFGARTHAARTRAAEEGARQKECANASSRHLWCPSYLGDYWFRPFCAVAQGPSKVVERIKQLGGIVSVDEKQPDKPLKQVYLNRTAVTDADLELFRGLTKLQLLDLTETGVSDKGAEHVGTLT